MQGTKTTNSNDLPDDCKYLCGNIRQGKLSEAKKTIMALEAAWSGFISWIDERSIQVLVADWSFPSEDTDLLPLSRLP